MLRRIWLADHRGRDAIVVLVPRQHNTSTTRYADGAGTQVRFSRRIKATDSTTLDSSERSTSSGASG